MCCCWDQPGSPLPHPCLEYVTHLKLYSETQTVPGYFTDPYPAVSLPNLTHLYLYIEFESYEDSHNCFHGVANLLPCLDPSHLLLKFGGGGPEPDEYVSTFGRYTATWSKLERIIFLVDYFEDSDPENMSKEMARLLYDSVAHLQGLPMIEGCKPRVVFNWRKSVHRRGDSDEVFDIIGRLTGD